MSVLKKIITKVIKNVMHFQNITRFSNKKKQKNVRNFAKSNHQNNQQINRNIELFDNPLFYPHQNCN